MEAVERDVLAGPEQRAHLGASEFTQPPARTGVVFAARAADGRVLIVAVDIDLRFAFAPPDAFAGETIDESVVDAEVSPF